MSRACWLYRFRISVLSDKQKQFANVLAAAHGACLGQQKADNNVYDQTRGKDLIDDAKNITETVAKVIGRMFSVSKKGLSRMLQWG